MDPGKITWTQLEVHKQKLDDVVAPWLAVLESIGQNTHLKIKSKGSWRVAVGDGVLPACGPDGLTSLTFSNHQLLVTGCPFGALVGKFGGSSASSAAATMKGNEKTPAANAPAQSNVSPAVDQPFAVGAFCLLQLPKSTVGPLFIGFNTVSRPVHIEKLEVEICGACLDISEGAKGHGAGEGNGAGEGSGAGEEQIVNEEEK